MQTYFVLAENLFLFCSTCYLYTLVYFTIKITVIKQMSPIAVGAARKYFRLDLACFMCDELDFQLIKHSIWPAVSTHPG